MDGKVLHTGANELFGVRLRVANKITQEEIRNATGLRDWEKAQALVRDWEAEGQLLVETENVGAGSSSFPRNEGYARGTWKDQRG